MLQDDTAATAAAAAAPREDNQENAEATAETPPPLDFIGNAKPIKNAETMRVYDPDRSPFVNRGSSHIIIAILAHGDVVPFATEDPDFIYMITNKVVLFSLAGPSMYAFSHPTKFDTRIEDLKDKLHFGNLPVNAVLNDARQEFMRDDAHTKIMIRSGEKYSDEFTAKPFKASNLEDQIKAVDAKKFAYKHLMRENMAYASPPVRNVSGKPENLTEFAYDFRIEILDIRYPKNSRQRDLNYDYLENNNAFDREETGKYFAKHLFNLGIVEYMNYNGADRFVVPLDKLLYYLKLGLMFDNVTIYEVACRTGPEASYEDIHKTFANDRKQFKKFAARTNFQTRGGRRRRLRQTRKRRRRAHRTRGRY